MFCLRNESSSFLPPPLPSLWTPSAAITSLPSTSVNRTSKASELDGERQCLHLVCGRTRLLQSVRLRPVPKCLSRLKAIVFSHLTSQPSSPSQNCFGFFGPQIWVNLCYGIITWSLWTCRWIQLLVCIKQILLCFLQVIWCPWFIPLNLRRLAFKSQFNKVVQAMLVQRVKMRQLDWCWDGLPLFFL